MFWDQHLQCAVLLPLWLLRQALWDGVLLLLKAYGRLPQGSGLGAPVGLI